MLHLLGSPLTGVCRKDIKYLSPTKGWKLLEELNHNEFTKKTFALWR
jgi:hypothetical protein